MIIIQYNVTSCCFFVIYNSKWNHLCFVRHLTWPRWAHAGELRNPIINFHLSTLQISFWSRQYMFHHRRKIESYDSTSKITCVGSILYHMLVVLRMLCAYGEAACILTQQLRKQAVYQYPWWEILSCSRQSGECVPQFACLFIPSLSMRSALHSCEWDLMQSDTAKWRASW